MYFAYDNEQEEYRRTVRAFFDTKLPHAGLPRLIETLGGREPAIWPAMAEQLGVQGLAIPEAFGGAGYGKVELGLVMEEAGYALLPGALFATIALAVPALLRSADDNAQAGYLPQIASGKLTATLAWRNPPQCGPVVARSADRHRKFTLTGVSDLVPSGADVDLLLALAQLPEGENALRSEVRCGRPLLSGVEQL